MKLKQKVALVVLLVLTIGLMFVPFATFNDGRSSVMNEDIVKYTERRDKEINAYNRYVEQGKAQKDLDKQMGKIDKAQATLDKYLYELYAIYIDNRLSRNKAQLETMDAKDEGYAELQAAIAADEAVMASFTFSSKGRIDKISDEQMALIQPLYDTHMLAFFGVDTTDMDEDARNAAITELKHGRGTEFANFLLMEIQQDASHKIRVALLPANIPEASLDPNVVYDGAAWEGLTLNKKVIKSSMAPDANDPKKQVPIFPVTFDEESVNIIDNGFGPIYACTYVVLALLIATIVLVLLAKDKLVSKFYTFAGFTNLLAILLMAYTTLRVAAIPVDLPYSNAAVNWWLVGLMLVLPIAAMFINIKAITNTKRTMIYVLCIFFSILSLLPFWIMIVNATRSSQAIQSGVSLIPSNFLMHNWTVLQTKNFNILTGFKNSAIIAFGSTLLNVYFSALTAYGLTVYRFRGSKLMYAIVMAIIMVPGQVTSTGFFMFMYQLGWTNSYMPLVIPAIASASTVFFFKQYLEANFQVSLVEAARIDGAGEFFTFNRIILPIMLPAMATMGIMAIIGSWNNYLTPLMLLSTDDMKTLPMMVKELRGDIYRTEYGSIYLGLTLTALPLMIVYFALSDT